MEGDVEAMKMSDRKKKILQIVVDEYINTAVPVSSKNIAEKHLQGVSSATVRNELASLEELGYLTQFHTSGGRVPSPQAYRFYIEELMEKGNLSDSDLDYIEKAFSDKSNDVEHLIKNVSKVISDLTDYTSVAIGPHNDEERIRNLALLACGEGKALLVIVTGTRMLRDSFIDIPEGMTDEELSNASHVIGKLFEGKALSEVKDVEEEVLSEFGQYRQVMHEVIDALKEYTRPRDEDVVLTGADKIFNHPEYEDIENVKNFLTVISDKDKIAELIGDGDDEIQINVKIGSSGDADVPDDCSVVTATYSAGGKNLGTYGVIGPIRMDYTKVITVLENVGKALEGIVGSRGKDKKDDRKDDKNE